MPLLFNVLIALLTSGMSGLSFDADDQARWEPSADEIRRLGHRVVDLVADHLAGLPDQPVFRPFPNATARELLAIPGIGITTVEKYARQFYRILQTSGG